MRVQHGGQGQGRPGRPGGLEMVRAFDGERPGGQHLTGHPADWPGGHKSKPFAESCAVFLAAQPQRIYHCGRVRQRDRHAVEILAQVERFDSLIGVVIKPGTEIGQGLPPAQPAHRHYPHSALGLRHAAEGAAGQSGRDHHLAALPGWPQAVQVGQPGQVVEDQRPPALRAGKPHYEPSRAGLRVCVRVGCADRSRRRREPRHHCLTSGRVDPDQDVDRPGVPQRPDEFRCELRLTGTALRGRGCLSLRDAGQHRGLARKQG